MCEAYQLTFCVFADKVVLGAAVFIIPLEQETTLRCFRGLVIQNYAHFLTARWLVPVPVPATNKMHKFRLYINFLSFFCLTADRDRWLFLLTPMGNLQSPITNLIKLHVFGLREKPMVPQENGLRYNESVQASLVDAGFKHRTHLLCGSNPNHHTTVLSWAQTVCHLFLS